MSFLAIKGLLVKYEVNSFGSLEEIIFISFNVLTECPIFSPSSHKFAMNFSRLSDFLTLFECLIIHSCFVQLSSQEDTGARRHARIALCEVATDLDVGAGAVRDVPGAMELLTTLAGSGGLNDEELTPDEGSRDERRERKAARKALRRIEQSLPPDHRYSDRL